MLESIKSARKAVGIKQATKALNKGEVDYIIIADDTEPGVLENVLNLGRQKGIRIETAETMKQLGKATGISVGAAIVAILR